MSLRIIPLAAQSTLEVDVDLASALLAATDDAGQRLRDDDVVVVASKVVALAEGAVVDLPEDLPDDRGRRALARAVATRVVADHPRVLVVATHHGLVCANAGIDTSNAPPGRAVLLPADPDASAARLRDQVRERTGADVGVVVTDTFGRPWRQGQVDVAIGAAGLEVLRDERGGRDLLGRSLDVTMAAVADEVAGAADLVRRKDAAVPFVLVRGLRAGGDATAAMLVRSPHEDLFPAGGPTMADHVVAQVHDDRARRDDHLGDPRVDGDAPPRLATLAAGPGIGVEVDEDESTGTVVVHFTGASTPDGLVALGASVGRLGVLAAVRGWSLAVDPVDDGAVTVHLDRGSASPR